MIQIIMSLGVHKSVAGKADGNEMMTMMKQQREQSEVIIEKHRS